MNVKKLLLFASYIVASLIISCESDEFLLNEDFQSNNLGAEISSKKPNRNGNDGSSGSETSTSLSKGTYELAQAVNNDPLFMFTVKGKSVTLNSNPLIGVWGTDFYGYWANSFTLSGNAIQYTVGLSTTIYEFNVQSNNTVNVIKTLIVQPYQSSAQPTTTITNVGLFTKQ